MAKRLKRLTILEASLVDRPANPGARVLLFKRHADPEDHFDPGHDPGAQNEDREEERDEMATKNTLDQAIKDRCTALGKDLLTAWSDPIVQQLYRKYQDAPPDVAAVEKRDLPGAKAWAMIAKRAGALRQLHPTMSEAAAIDWTLMNEPALYDAYRIERDGSDARG